MRFHLCAVLVLSALQVVAQTEISRLPATVIADRGKPGTVLIVTRVAVKGSCPRAVFDGNKLDTWFQDLRWREYQTSGNVTYYTDEEATLAKLAELVGNPAAYIVPGNQQRTIDRTLTYTGSGFIISSDGYVVTNAHVVKPAKDDISRSVAEHLIEWITSDLELTNRIVGELAPGRSLTDKAKENVTQALTAFYIEHMSFDADDQKVYALTGYAKPGQSVEAVGKLADVKKTGKEIPGKDVAILKIPGNNYPTLPLVDAVAANNIRTGEELHVVGYPSVATFSEALSVSSQIEPSMTNGRVSALKAMADGWRVIQTDAPLAPGNSGGPVLNDLGQVIGIATFASVDPTTGQQVQGFNFVVPTDVVREFLRESNVTPAESAFTTTYNKGLDEYQRKFYKSALELFRAASDQSPDLPYVREYIARCRQEIDAGRDESWKKNLWILQLGGGVIGLLLIVFILALLLARRRPAPLPRQTPNQTPG